MTCTICRTDPCHATVNLAIMDAVPVETKRRLWAGHLQQTCPTCGHVEPAGLRCSKCSGTVLPVDWHPRRISEAQRLARESSGASLHTPSRQGADS